MYLRFKYFIVIILNIKKKEKKKEKNYKALGR